MVPVQFHLGDVYKDEKAVYAIKDKYEKQFGIKLNTRSSKSFEVARCKKPPNSDLKLYELHYYCNQKSCGMEVKFMATKKVKRECFEITICKDEHSDSCKGSNRTREEGQNGSYGAYLKFV